ncbi:hypothetical protein ANFP_17720 [Acidithiobacillus ferrooxidans]|uniref:Uncharacterized protein n=1 Tax=Acidithiobacillus ferrooxidans TaxID=920 RepID=A0A2W1K0D5_ACIFR|nr:hypothetical protein DN052_15940 [Acidithiobacillus ferrooxidans]BDB14452.1 hypothetical protein ANFP_17720 [Acidithiobacillus ferrooxidans]
MRTFLADFIRASRLNVLHQRPDIRLQPDLNMSDIAILLHTWRHPYKCWGLFGTREISATIMKSFALYHLATDAVIL